MFVFENPVENRGWDFLNRGGRVKKNKGKNGDRKENETGEKRKVEPRVPMPPLDLVPTLGSNRGIDEDPRRRSGPPGTPWVL